MDLKERRYFDQRIRKLLRVSFIFWNQRTSVLRRRWLWVHNPRFLRVCNIVAWELQFDIVWECNSTHGGEFSWFSYSETFSIPFVHKPSTASPSPSTAPTASSPPSQLRFSHAPPNASCCQDATSKKQCSKSPSGKCRWDLENKIYLNILDEEDASSSLGGD